MQIVDGKLVPTTQEKIAQSVADAIVHGRCVGFRGVKGAVCSANLRAIEWNERIATATSDEFRLAYAAQVEYWIRTAQGYLDGACEHEAEKEVTA